MNLPIIILFTVRIGVADTTGFNANLVPDTALYLSHVDAERILGQSVKLVGRSYKLKDCFLYKCSYQSIVTNNPRGKAEKLDFNYERYQDEHKAKSAFALMEAANERKPGMMNIRNLGDDAYIQIDTLNYHFMMVRKHNNIIKVRINKLLRNSNFLSFTLYLKQILNRL